MFDLSSLKVMRMEALGYSLRLQQAGGRGPGLALACFWPSFHTPGGWTRGLGEVSGSQRRGSRAFLLFSTRPRRPRRPLASTARLLGYEIACVALHVLTAWVMAAHLSREKKIIHISRF